MEKIAFVIGGSGYIGGFLIERLLASNRFHRIYNMDLVESGIRDERCTFLRTDVREPIRLDAGPFDPKESWIFNLAALCREPGSEPREYFDTNVRGAETVCAFAGRIGCENIFFTSTMSSYGYMPEPTSESAPQYPETPYGISKLVGEKIHQTWFASSSGRRLVICRPGVIFGPGDVGNIGRMIKAIKKGYFFFPGDPGITKAYGYINDLIRSIEFVLLRRDEPVIIYNFAQDPLLNLSGMVTTIKTILGKPGSRSPRVPVSILVLAAQCMQFAAGLFGKASPIHPVRVRKVAFPTHIRPQYLIDHGFKWEFSFESALLDWKMRCPEEF